MQGGKHGDDVGEYNTAGGPTKGLAGVSTVRRQVDARSRVGAGAQKHPDMSLFLILSALHIL